MRVIFRAKARDAAGAASSGTSVAGESAEARPAGALARELARAPAHLRTAAVLLDVMLALSALLLLRHGIRLGLVRPLGAWSADGGAWIDTQLVILTLLLTLLRDVPGGASPAKWLLCLREVAADGRRIGLGRRLWHAPSSLLPYGWPLRRRQGRVIAYDPGTRGLLLRAALTLVVASVTFGWAIETVRPSIGRRDAERLSRQLVFGDPVLQRALGLPLEFRILGITDRAHQPGRGRQASFELLVTGSLRRQDMTVHACKVDGTWVVEEADDISITPIEPGVPVATR